MKYDFDALRRVFEKLSLEDVDLMAKAIKSHRRIFVYGAGRSGLMLKAFAMRMAQAGLTVYAVTETVTPAIEKGDLLILASASGSTASVCRYAQIAREVGASVYSVTATRGSELAALSDSCTYLYAPTKDSAQDTFCIMGTLFEEALLLFCDTVVTGLCENVGMMRARHANLE